MPKTLLAGAIASAMLTQFNADAYVVGNYTPDAFTLHLWHFDEAGTPATDAGGNPVALTSLAGGATLGNASFSRFGTALSTADGGQAATTAAGKDAVLSARPLANSSADNVAMAYAGADGAFTMEAVVRIDFDPALNYGPTASGGNGRLDQMQIISGDDEANGGRIFQFRIDPVGTTSGNAVPQLHFINLHGAVGVQDIIFEIPTTGPNAIALNKWYHAAVVYDGVESGVDNIKLYWTALEQEPSPLEANLIGASSMQYDLLTGSTDLCIGNEGRSTGGASGNFVGLIDELRMSSVARAANAMQLVDPKPDFAGQPVNEIVAAGQPASFSVLATGVELSYQWRLDGASIDGENKSVIDIPAAGAANVGSYDVMVTNSYGSKTSEVATLTVRTPLDLTWVGSSDWDTNNLFWDSNSDSAADAAYTEGDNVLFDGQGLTTVNIPDRLHPSSVRVNSTVDYTLGSTTGGGLTRNASLTKSGAGMLILDTANSYTGPTTVTGGVLQIGSGGASGTLGTGPVTNNATLVFNTTAISTINSTVAGSGDIINRAAGNLQLLGTNALSQSADIILERGVLTLGPAALSQVTNIVVTGYGTGLGAGVSLAENTTIPAQVVTRLSATNETDSATYTNDWRAHISNLTGTNAWNGPLLLSGNNAVFANAGGFLEVNGPISGPEFSYQFAMRGNGNGALRGQVTLPKGAIAKTDGGTWTVYSTGVNNTYLYALVVGGRLQNGNENALATNAFLQLGGGSYDLGGFNQVIAGLSNNTSGARMITNGAMVNSALTLRTPAAWAFQGIFADGYPMSGKLGLRLTGGGSLTLTGANAHHGDTIVESGTLALADAGSIGMSEAIDIRAGATLNVSGRTDAKLTIGPGQTLRGDGTFNIHGVLASAGTIEMKVAKSSSAVSADKISGLTTLVYGGKLKLLLSGEGLSASDTLPLFSAAGYSSTFAEITPATPGAGMVWNTNTLATDGILRINSSVATYATNITVVPISGSRLELSWPESHKGWTLTSQTNGLTGPWYPVQSSQTTNRLFMDIDPATGSVFYRMALPQ